MRGVEERTRGLMLLSLSSLCWVGFFSVVESGSVEEEDDAEEDPGGGGSCGSSCPDFSDAVLSQFLKCNRHRRLRALLYVFEYAL